MGGFVFHTSSREIGGSSERGVVRPSMPGIRSVARIANSGEDRNVRRRSKSDLCDKALRLHFDAAKR
jgi:hypothetical protein